MFTDKTTPNKAKKPKTPKQQSRGKSDSKKTKRKKRKNRKANVKSAKRRLMSTKDANDSTSSGPFKQDSVFTLESLLKSFENPKGKQKINRCFSTPPCLSCLSITPLSKPPCLQTTCSQNHWKPRSLTAQICLT